MTVSSSCRLGFYINMPDGTFDASVLQKQLGERQIAEMQAALQVALDVEPFVVSYEVLELSHSNLNIVVQRACEVLGEVSPNMFPDLAVVHDTKIELQHGVMDFLSSQRAFLDHTETHLKRLYGKNSTEFLDFKRRTNILFDSKFSYKFLYQLRHMAQHVTVPISNIAFNMDRQNISGCVVRNTTLMINRKKLLENWSNWKPLVRTAIEEQNADFALMPLIGENMTYLKELCQSSILYQQIRLRQFYDFLDLLSDTIKPTQGAIPVIWIGEASRGSPPTSVEYIPFEEGRRIAKILDWKANASSV